jgi:hypothetical protein
MVLVYCSDCHCDVHMMLPPGESNINPNNGNIICQECYHTKYSIDAIRDKKLETILKGKSNWWVELIDKISTSK